MNELRVGIEEEAARGRGLPAEPDEPSPPDALTDPYTMASPSIAPEEALVDPYFQVADLPAEVLEPEMPIGEDPPQEVAKVPNVLADPPGMGEDPPEEVPEPDAPADPPAVREDPLEVREVLVPKKRFNQEELESVQAKILRIRHLGSLGVLPFHFNFFG